ncbi:MAG: lysophospholipid acyltransferase family protein [Planctomycetota bacterium]|jgi:1-acyl-sn-glycerol-3-phosphate acyltransferase
MRSVLLFLIFWFYLFACMPHLILAILLEWCGKPEWSRLLAERQSLHWGRFILKMTGSRVSVEGLGKVPTEGGAVIVANHQGAMDIPLVLGFLGRPVAFVAKKELRRIPLMGTWMKRMRCQFLDRDDRRQGLEVVKRSVDFLQSGGVMVVFPEGTRSRGGPLANFKKGSLRMAIKAGVPIIPTTIVDSYKIWEANGGWIHPADIKLILGDPIPTADLDKNEQNELVNRTREVIATALAAQTHAGPTEAATDE